MVTIKDVAQRTGLSPATVSKALNGYADINCDTRERVRLAAREMGYRPNASARALKTRRSYNLGVLFADEAQSGLRHPYFSHVLDGFRVFSDTQGYDVTFIGHALGGTRHTTYLEHCHARGVDGVCIACVDWGNAEVEGLAADNLPVVAIDHLRPGTAAVCSENRQGMRLLLEHIVALGHRDILYIHGQQNPVTHERLAGFQNTLIELCVPLRSDMLQAAAYLNAELSCRHTLQLLARKTRPTCILYPDDNCALAALSVLRGAGLRVPEDISVAGFDGLGPAADITPHLTTAVQNAEAVGREAARLLIDRIERPFSTPLANKTIPVSLRTGETTAKSPRG